MSDRRVSKEELEAFWRGDRDTYQRMYSQRMRQKADAAERQGKQVTYVSNDGSETLPEVTVTAPRETEEQRQARFKQDYENLVDNAITVAGFVPGVDTFADIADIGNSWRKGDYSGMLWGVAQFQYKPRLTDNKRHLVSPNASRYFAVPTKIEHQYTLWHKSGGKL